MNREEIRKKIALAGNRRLQIVEDELDARPDLKARQPELETLVDSIFKARSHDATEETRKEIALRVNKRVQAVEDAYTADPKLAAHRAECEAIVEAVFVKRGHEPRIRSTTDDSKTNPR